MHHADVDEIPGTRFKIILPGNFNVSLHEARVCRYVFGLNEVEIQAEMEALRKFIGHIYGPYASAASQIEDSRVFLVVYRDGNELLVADSEKHPMEEVKSILLLLVNGKHVLPLFERAIPSAVFLIHLVVDAVRYCLGRGSHGDAGEGNKSCVSCGHK